MRNKRLQLFSIPSCPSHLKPGFPVPANKCPTPKFHLNPNGPLSYCQSPLICCDTNRTSTPRNSLKVSFQNYPSLSHLQREIARNCTKWLKCNHVSSLFNVQSCSHVLSRSPPVLVTERFLVSIEAQNKALQGQAFCHRFPRSNFSSRHAHVVNYARKSDLTLLWSVVALGTVGL